MRALREIIVERRHCCWTAKIWPLSISRRATFECLDIAVVCSGQSVRPFHSCTTRHTPSSQRYSHFKAPLKWVEELAEQGPAEYALQQAPYLAVSEVYVREAKAYIRCLVFKMCVWALILRLVFFARAIQKPRLVAWTRRIDCLSLECFAMRW